MTTHPRGAPVVGVIHRGRDRALLSPVLLPESLLYLIRGCQTEVGHIRTRGQVWGIAVVSEMAHLTNTVQVD